MGAFKAAIDELNLKELRLNGRHFTWSNEQDRPTLTRIDRLLCIPDWELTFPTYFLHSLPSLMSDHMPLLLHGEIEHYKNPSFGFEIFWVKMEGFNELVEQIWNRPVHSVLPLGFRHGWNKTMIRQFYATLEVHAEQVKLMWMTGSRRFEATFSDLATAVGLDYHRMKKGK